MMKKLFVSLLIVLLTFSGVFAEAIPPFPFIGDCTGVGNGKTYDCTVNFLLYWLNFPLGTGEQDFYPLRIFSPSSTFKLGTIRQRGYYYEDETGGPPKLLLEVLIPFAAFALILYGFSSQLQIFGSNNWINIVLSILMVLVSAKIGIFNAIVVLVFSIAPTYAFILWAILFFFGIWVIFRKGISKGKTAISTASVINDGLRSLNNERASLISKKNHFLMQLANPGIDDARATQLNNSITTIDARLKIIEGQIQELRIQ